MKVKEIVSNTAQCSKWINFTMKSQTFLKKSKKKKKKLKVNKCMDLHVNEIHNDIDSITLEKEVSQLIQTSIT